MSCPVDLTRRSASTIAVSIVSGSDGFISINGVCTHVVAGMMVWPSALFKWLLNPFHSWQEFGPRIWDRNWKSLARARLAATTWDASTVRFKTDLVAFMCGISGRLGPLYLWTGTSRSTCAAMSSFRMRGIVSATVYYVLHHKLQFVSGAQQVHSRRSCQQQPVQDLPHFVMH